MSEIIMSVESLEAMHQHLEQVFPNEGCGFLYGKENGSRYIQKAIPVENAKAGDQSRRFEISALDYIKAEQYAIENDIQLLGIYHSHPNHPAIASSHDLAVAMPYFSYVIVSVRDGLADDVKSWKLKEDKRVFQEEKVWVDASALTY